MREKLEKIIEAYKELELKLGDPAVLADQHEYNKLAKSFSDQGPLVEARSISSFAGTISSRA